MVNLDFLENNVEIYFIFWNIVDFLFKNVKN